MTNITNISSLPWHTYFPNISIPLYRPILLENPLISPNPPSQTPPFASKPLPEASELMRIHRNKSHDRGRTQTKGTTFSRTHYCSLMYVWGVSILSHLPMIQVQMDIHTIFLCSVPPSPLLHLVHLWLLVSLLPSLQVITEQRPLVHI